MACFINWQHEQKQSDISKTHFPTHWPPPSAITCSTVSTETAQLNTKSWKSVSKCFNWNRTVEESFRSVSKVADRHSQQEGITRRAAVVPRKQRRQKKTKKRRQRWHYQEGCSSPRRIRCCTSSKIHLCFHKHQSRACCTLHKRRFKCARLHSIQFHPLFKFVLPMVCMLIAQQLVCWGSADQTSKSLDFPGDFWHHLVVILVNLISPYLHLDPKMSFNWGGAWSQFFDPRCTVWGSRACPPHLVSWGLGEQWSQSSS